jgi:hypothetical protein
VRDKQERGAFRSLKARVSKAGRRASGAGEAGDKVRVLEVQGRVIKEVGRNYEAGGAGDQGGVGVDHGTRKHGFGIGRLWSTLEGNYLCNSPRRGGGPGFQGESGRGVREAHW